MSESPLSKRFGVTVRKRRSEAGLSQETLAELAQLHPNYVGMVERGIRNPTLDVASRIAKALKITFQNSLKWWNNGIATIVRARFGCSCLPPSKTHQQFLLYSFPSPKRMQISKEYLPCPPNDAGLLRGRGELRLQDRIA